MGRAPTDLIRPIVDEESYAWGLQEMEAYLEHSPTPGSPEARRFTALADALETYEDAQEEDD